MGRKKFKFNKVKKVKAPNRKRRKFVFIPRKKRVKIDMEEGVFICSKKERYIKPLDRFFTYPNREQELYEANKIIMDLAKKYNLIGKVGWEVYCVH